MHVTAADLTTDLNEPSGGAFEGFLFDLLALEAERVGISASRIRWDPRPNVGDGGRDIVVPEGTNDLTSLIPRTPSIWSAKAGKYGTSPATLGGEIHDHDKVRAFITNGGSYRYAVLAPCSQGEQDALANKAKSLCEEYDWAAGAVEPVFSPILARATGTDASIIFNHLPALARQLGPDAIPAQVWINDLRTTSQFVYAPTPSRSDIVDELRGLIGAQSEDRYLHVMGWSGVGKTRLVAEALDATEAKSRVVVYGDWPAFERGLLGALNSRQVTASVIIVDEVDIERVPALAGIVQSRPGVRVISIGASEYGDQQPRHCMFLPRPTEGDIEAILRTRLGSILADEAVSRIASLCDGDIRFAELLCTAAQDLDAEQQSPGALISALTGIGAIVSMYLGRHRVALGDPADFQRRLSTVATLADVGCAGDNADELRHLAGLRGIEPVRLTDTVIDAERIGLCRRVGDLVECVPRPLATYLFERHVWPSIQADLLVFFQGLPGDRARRAFLRRVTYCSQERRGEVNRSLGDMFRRRYRDMTLGDLEDPNAARTLRMLIETIPQHGLMWLRELVERADLSALRMFRGSRGAFGPSYGRREVVWLCEHLRCFADCFRDAERILFRLALTENEQLGNNATAEWQQCFWWQLSGTEVPLPERIDILLERLGKPDENTMPLLMQGVVAALHEPMGALAPPAVVGGRLTPPEWRPETWGEIFEQWDRLNETTTALAARNDPVGRTAREAVLANLELFIRRGVPNRLRGEVFAGSRTDEAMVRQLRKELERLVGPHSEVREDVVADLERWLVDLRPTDLAARIRDVVGRDTWEHQQHSEDMDAWRQPYEEIAAAVAVEPEVLDTMVEWLGSDAAQSASAFGAALGRDEQAQGAVRSRVAQWIASGSATDLVVGYFIGVSGEERAIADWAAEILEANAVQRPDAVVRVTVEADCTIRGLNRLFRCLPRCESPPSQLLGRLFGHHWEGVLGPDSKRQVLEILDRADSDKYAARCAFSLMTMWHHRHWDDVPETIEAVVGRLVVRGVQDLDGGRVHEWEQTTKWWVRRNPPEGARLLTELMTADKTKLYRASRSAEKLLDDLATTAPDAVAEAIEDTLTDEKRWLFFQIGVYRGLFEKLGGSRIEQMVTRLGERGAIAIARHLPDPDSSTGGELALRFLEAHGSSDEVFRSYIAGRHSGRVFRGHAFDRRSEVYRRTEPYLTHQNDRVRDWAAWERYTIDQWAERDRKMVEEMGRE